MKELEKKNFGKRLQPYNKPAHYVVLGFICSAIQGCIFPVFGIFITKMLFILMNFDKHKLREDSNAWCLYMFIAALVSLFNGFI